MIDPRFKAAMAIVVVALLAGVGLFLAPFMLEYQAATADWVTATKHHVATGAAVVGVSLATLASAWTLTLRGLGATGAAPVAHDEPET